MSQFVIIARGVNSRLVRTPRNTWVRALPAINDGLWARFNSEPAAQEAAEEARDGIRNAGLANSYSVSVERLDEGGCLVCDRPF